MAITDNFLLGNYAYGRLEIKGPVLRATPKEVKEFEEEVERNRETFEELNTFLDKALHGVSK